MWHKRNADSCGGRRIPRPRANGNVPGCWSDPHPSPVRHKPQASSGQWIPVCFQIFRLSSIAPLGKFDRTVVVAMIPVRVMQVTVDKIINVIPMWHRFVTAPGAMDVSRIVAAAVVARRSLVRISRADLEPVLVYVIVMRMVQMPIMQIIDVIAVPDSGMATVRAMLMVVMGMVGFVATAHREAPRFTWRCQREGRDMTSPRWRATSSPAAEAGSIR